MSNKNEILKLLLRKSINVDSEKLDYAIKKLSDSPSITHHYCALENEVKRFIHKNRVKKKILSEDVENKPEKPLNVLSPIQRPKLQNIIFLLSNVLTDADVEIQVVLPQGIDGVLELDSITGFPDGESAISVDFNTNTIKGRFSKPAQLNLVFEGVVRLPSGKIQLLSGIGKMQVIANPKLLWQNNPSDINARFHKKDIDSMSIEDDKVKLIAVSVRGRSHAHKGTHRDDDFNLLQSGSSGWNVLCVADGAGSAKYSRRGAEVAALNASKTLKETLSGRFGDDLEQAFIRYTETPTDENKIALAAIQQHTIVKAAHTAYKSILDEMDGAQGDTVKDFNTTLLVCAHKQCDDGHLVVSFWIGDGVAAIYTKNQEVVLLGTPDSGEFSGQTRFLDARIFADNSVYDRVVIKKVKDFTAIVLATDGITDPKFETEYALGQLDGWDELWHELEPILNQETIMETERQLVSWMDFFSKGHHDDRTMAICLLKDKADEQQN